MHKQHVVLSKGDEFQSREARFIFSGPTDLKVCSRKRSFEVFSLLGSCKPSKLNCSQASVVIRGKWERSFGNWRD